MSIITQESHILIVDDDSFNLDLIARILTKADFKIQTAMNGIDAIAKIEQDYPRLILLDGMMPYLDGFETCQRLKENPLVKHIPIIFMSALTEQEKKIQAFKLGVSDYVTKPFQRAELLARVQYQIELINLRQALEDQNTKLQEEVNKKYEVELSLLDINEQLSQTNKILIKEIESRKTIEIKLQREISERLQAEAIVKQSLKEKELLIKEIHHRVKNNLFIVSSILESQEDYLTDSQATKVLENSRSRIMSMALIHEQLHGNTSISEINFTQYLTNLTDHLIESYLTQNITFTINIPQIFLNIETAQPCGLIVNELISNALEHAFTGRSRGKINVNFEKIDSREYILVCEDDGIGFPEHKNFFDSESLGLELVFTLVEQLEGTIEMNSDRGTKITITFKELNYEDRI